MELSVNKMEKDSFFSFTAGGREKNTTKLSGGGKCCEEYNGQ